MSLSDKEVVRELKEFISKRAKGLEFNKNNPRMNWKTAGQTELSNVLFKLDEVFGEDLI